MKEATHCLSGAEELWYADCGFPGWAISAPSRVTHHQASKGASSSHGDGGALCHWEEASVFPLGSEIAAAEKSVWAEVIPLISCVLCLHTFACPSVCLAPPHLWDLMDLVGWSLEQLGLVKVGGTARALRAFPTQTMLWFCLAPTSVRSRHLRLQSDREFQLTCVIVCRFWNTLF